MAAKLALKSAHPKQQVARPSPIFQISGPFAQKSIQVRFDKVITCRLGRSQTRLDAISVRI